MSEDTMRTGSLVDGSLEDFFSLHPKLRGKDILVAFSGGVDSSVMLTALASASFCSVRAVHVVHGLRNAEELDAEREIVRATCRLLNVPLTIATIKRGVIQKLAKEKGIGTEAAARALRYGILKRTARRVGCSLVCTAHNADDQLETLISRFLSASSLDGLSGMKAVRNLGEGIALIRPLLTVSREEIQRYAIANNVSISTDSTNASQEFSRNRIRHTLVPVLDSGFPGWRKGLLETAKRLTSDREILERNLAEVLGACHFDREKKIASIDAGLFKSVPVALKTRILARGLAAVGRRGRFSYKALRSAADSIGRGAPGLDLLGVRISLREGRLEFLPILDFRTEDSYFFQVASEGLYRAGPMCVSVCWDRNKAFGVVPADGEEKREGFLFEGSFEFPLVVRSRKPGDLIGTPEGEKKIDDLLQSWHMGKRFRDVIPVIEDRRGIVAVLASALAGADLEQEKFRDFNGPRDGRRLYIRIKGA